MRSLGGFILPSGTRWLNRYEWQNSRKNFQRTTGGGHVANVQRTYKGQTITLDFENVWLTTTQIKQLAHPAYGLAADPAATLQFTWDDENHLVMFNDPPHSFPQLHWLDDEESDVFQGGQVNLISV